MIATGRTVIQYSLSDSDSHRLIWISSFVRLVHSLQELMRRSYLQQGSRSAEADSQTVGKQEKLVAKQGMSVKSTTRPKLASSFLIVFFWRFSNAVSFDNASGAASGLNVLFCGAAYVFGGAVKFEIWFWCKTCCGTACPPRDAAWDPAKFIQYFVFNRNTYQVFRQWIFVYISI